MEPSHKLNCDVRVKEESIDAPLVENNWEMMDEKPDLEHFQLLPFSRENSIHPLQKCGIKLENELEDEVQIIVECEDLKPNVDLLLPFGSGTEIKISYLALQLRRPYETLLNPYKATKGIAKPKIEIEYQAVVLRANVSRCRD
ncbi:hypothetical protein TKK_0007091 [Trichogramma kaykai]